MSLKLNVVGIGGITTVSIYYPRHLTVSQMLKDTMVEAQIQDQLVQAGWVCPFPPLVSPVDFCRISVGTFIESNGFLLFPDGYYQPPEDLSTANADVDDLCQAVNGLGMNQETLRSWADLAVQSLHEADKNLSNHISVLHAQLELLTHRFEHAVVWKNALSEPEMSPEIIAFVPPVQIDPKVDFAPDIPADEKQVVSQEAVKESIEPTEQRETCVSEEIEEWSEVLSA